MADDVETGFTIKRLRGLLEENGNYRKIGPSGHFDVAIVAHETVDGEDWTVVRLTQAEVPAGDDWTDVPEGDFVVLESEDW